MKVMMTDLDGTLFDTRRVNFLAYSEAVKPYGYTLDYEYYCSHCNGRYYLDFLPQITTNDMNVLQAIHNDKLELYYSYLSEARINNHLVNIMKMARTEYKIALVTTASRKNTYEILSNFNMMELFDLILTNEDIEYPKPDPFGYLKAMEYFGASADNCIIFEDSDIGIDAAVASGASCFIVRGFN